MGCAELLAAVEAGTAAQGSVLLTGPSGIGTFVLLQALAGARGEHAAWGPHPARCGPVRRRGHFMGVSAPP